jgi:hypothetical protein
LIGQLSEASRLADEVEVAEPHGYFTTSSPPMLNNIASTQYIQDITMVQYIMCVPCTVVLYNIHDLYP